jgi:hypothetical protein
MKRAALWSGLLLLAIAWPGLGCRWSATQTMYYGLTPFGAGASYSTSMIGMFLDGVRASTTRGGVTQYYNLGPD